MRICLKSGLLFNYVSTVPDLTNLRCPVVFYLTNNIIFACHIAHQKTMCPSLRLKSVDTLHLQSWVLEAFEAVIVYIHVWSIALFHPCLCWYIYPHLIVTNC